MTGFIAHREARWEYTMETVQHVEEHNCVQGCVHARGATPEEPGGHCPVLIHIALEEPVPEIIDDGVNLLCIARTPR